MSVIHLFMRIVDWDASSTLNNNNNLFRISTQTIDITTGNTVFSPGSGVNAIPFISSFTISPNLVSGVPSPTTAMEFFLSAYLLGNVVVVNLEAKSLTKITFFQALIVLVDAVAINTAQTA